MKSHQTLLITAALILTVLASPAVSAETFTVDDNGGNYTSIQNAVDTEGSDTIIEVSDGTYDETVKFNSDVSNVTIEASDASSPPEITGGVSVQATDLTFRNVKLSGDAGSSRTINVGGGSVTNMVLEGVTFDGENNVNSALYGNSFSGDITLSDVEMANYAVDDWLFVNINTQTQLDNVEITGSTFRDNVGMVAFGEITDSVVIEDNTFKRFEAAALALGSPAIGDSLTASISDNTFEDNFNHVVLGDVDGETTQSVVDSNSFDLAAYTDTLITPSIQKAIDEASDGSTVTVEEGTYDEGVEITTPRLTLEGPNADVAGDSDQRGDEATISADAKEGVLIKATDVTVRGFTVTTNLDDTAKHGQSGIRVELSNDGENIVIEDNVIEDISDDYQATGIAVNAGGSVPQYVADNVTIQDNLIRDVSTLENSNYTSVAKGIGANERVNNLNILDNVISNIGSEYSAGALGISLTEDGGPETPVGPEDFTIRSNDISSLTVNDNDADPWYDPNALFIGGYPNLGDDHVVTQNDFNDGEVHRFSANNADTLKAASNWWGSSAGPQHSSNTFNEGSQGVSVSDKVDFTPWLDATDGDSFAPVENTDTEELFASIQAAVDSAGSDETIEAKEGTYSEKVVIDKGGLTLESVDNVKPLIHQDSSDWRAMHIKAADVTVDGFEVKNTDNEDDTNRVRGIYGNKDSSGLTIENTDVTKVDGDVPNANTEKKTGYGMYLFGDTTTVNDSTVKNVVGTKFAAGIRFGGNSNAVRNGGEISDVDISQLETTAAGGQAAGILLPSLGSSDKTTVKNSTVQSLDNNTGAAGVSVKSTNSDATSPHILLQNNDFSVSTDSQPGVAVYIENSTLSDLSNLNVTNNDFSGSDTGAGNAQPETTLDAEHNYWGAPSGPSDVGNGDGSAVSENVIFQPWLLEEDGEEFHKTYSLTVKDWNAVSFPSDVSDVELADEGKVLEYQGGWSVPDAVEASPLNTYFFHEDNKAIGIQTSDGASEYDREVVTGEEAGDKWNFVGAFNNDPQTFALFSTIRSAIDAVSYSDYNLDQEGNEVTNGISDYETEQSKSTSVYSGYWIKASENATLETSTPSVENSDSGTDDSNDESAAS